MRGDLLDRLPPEQAKVLREAPANPGSAMLATLSDRRDFEAGEWILERKLDGIRALAARDGDGSPFARLQRRIGLTRPADVRNSRVTVTYFVFDLLRLEGTDTTRLPLLERKSLLNEALDFAAPLRYTTHRRAARDARPALERACADDWEGLIAKRADAPYVHRRSPDWLKLKCAKGQEFVVGGFTEPQGGRVGFGALLLGYYQADGGFRYAGKVGTGWDTKTLRACCVPGLTRLEGRGPKEEAEGRGPTDANCVMARTVRA